MELHLPNIYEIREGDLLKYYTRPSWEMMYGIVLETHISQGAATVIVSKAGEYQGEIQFVMRDNFDKIYRFNPFDPDEHGSDVAYGHIEYMRDEGFITADLYATATPIIRTTEKVKR